MSVLAVLLRAKERQRLSLKRAEQAASHAVGGPTRKRELAEARDRAAQIVVDIDEAIAQVQDLVARADAFVPLKHWPDCRTHAGEPLDRCNCPLASDTLARLWVGVRDLGRLPPC